MTSHSRNFTSLILDFGGVIISISHRATEDAFRALGMTDFEKLFSHAMQSELFQRFEKDQVTPQQFREEIRQISKLALTDPQIDDAWNRIILDYPEHRIRLLERIGKHYRLILLSNTNRIHYDVYSDIFLRTYGKPLEQLFDRVIWSFDAGLRKPEPEIYHLALRESGIRAPETLFIDDNLINVQAAVRFGIPSLYLEPATDLADLFLDDRLVTEKCSGVMFPDKVE
ncbi:MAG: HAD family phosphatase [Bacteroidales bacterium]|nr:HAD family phosphatase [Bacteroidales bacterium]